MLDTPSSSSAAPFSDAKFVHLRVHTAYSMLEGTLRASDLTDYCKKYKAPALGITDSNGLFGIPEMSLALEKEGIKPLLGLEAQLCFERTGERVGEMASVGVGERAGERVKMAGRQRLRIAPLVFLAMNELGYANLMRLASALYRIEPLRIEPLPTEPLPHAEKGERTEKTYEQNQQKKQAKEQAKEQVNAEVAEKPFLELKQLQRYSEGIITLSGGLDGPLGVLLSEQRKREARDLAQRLSEIFPQRFYIELNRFAASTSNSELVNSRDDNRALAREQMVEEGLLELCRELQLPPLASNNCMFADQSMYEAHDVLLAIADGVRVSSEQRRRTSRAQELASPDKMLALFKDIPEACENTIQVAKRCSKVFEPRAAMLPNFKTEDGLSQQDALAQQAQQGLDGILNERLKFAQGDERRKPYQDRLELELGVIIEKGLQGYFLIVADFIRWAKKQDIPVGPGRGSGAGSLVAWTLGITALNPMRWGLLFERFLNPERMSMPDFDIDFCQERREQVIAYVRKRYGDDKVGQILTLGTLQARAAVRDVGRVLGIPYPRVDRLCKTIPPLISLKEASREKSSQLVQARKEPEIAKLLDLSLKLEGLYRHASTHAAGIVIGNRALLDLVPLYRDKQNDASSTQFTMKYVEQAGLIKFDFLGLKTLSVMAHCQKILKTRNIELDIDALELDSPRVLEIFARADTFGVFQFESSGIREVLRRMRPDRFEDIIAAVALYRPGPMEQISKYIERKHGEQEIVYLHEKLEPLLRETYGIPVYQEQVIQMAQVLAGFSLGASDHLRRAMGKKDPLEMEGQHKSFLDGCLKNGIEVRVATKIFEQIYAFAGYGFNKSHAAAYAMIAYQTAWLRVHHSVAFFTSMMVFDAENIERLAQYLPCLKSLNITLLPPDINYSKAEFSMQKFSVQAEEDAEKDAEEDAVDAIRYGLGAIKHVGLAAMQALVAEREKNGAFRNLFDLAERLAGIGISRRTLESLVRSGALDALNKNRAQSLKAIDLLLNVMQSKAAEQKQQDSLFGKGEQSVLAPRELPKVKAWEREREMNEEREAIGFYLSGHPLADSMEFCRQQGLRSSAELQEMRGGEKFRILGRLEAVREKRLKDSSRRLVLLYFSDPEGFFEATMFDKQAQKYPFLQNGAAEGAIGGGAVGGGVVGGRAEGAAIVLHLDCVRIEARDSVQMRVVKLVPFEKFKASVDRGVGKKITPQITPQITPLSATSATSAVDKTRAASAVDKTRAASAKNGAVDATSKPSANNGADALNATLTRAQGENQANEQQKPEVNEQHNPQAKLQAGERLKLFVGNSSLDWHPRPLAKLLADQARLGSGKIELYIRQENSQLRVSLAQNYLLDDSLEQALKSLDGIDRVERMQAA